MTSPPRHILPVIVLAQFCGTSLWFAGNAVTAALVRELSLEASVRETLTSSVQLGFVVGTLVFALLSLADRVSARSLFLVCSWLGASSTAVVPWLGTSALSLALLRFCTGFFLAGVYPVGMKIAAGWFGADLGRALGYLVGALVVGTAFPHAVLAWLGEVDYRMVFYTVSLLAAVGGALLFLLVPDGPLTRGVARFDPKSIVQIFALPRFRAAAFGYFGHMWELYAFWATVPWVIGRLLLSADMMEYVPLASFCVVGIGAFGCAVAGERGRVVGPARVAFENLGVSGICCLASPVLWVLPAPLAICYLLVWGWTVVADSAQFSSVAAREAPPQYVGSALTWMSCIGFFITIFSVELLGALTRSRAADWALWLLAPGPLLGIYSMRSLLRGTSSGAESTAD